MPADRTVSQFLTDANALDVDSFRAKHGDFFFVAPELKRASAQAMLAATHVAVSLDDMEPAADRAGPSPSHAVLYQSTGEEGLLSIGAAEHNDVIVDESSVSSGHAALFLRNGTYFIQDSGSTNGTFVNGEPVPAEGQGEAVGLHDGDEVRFGQVKTWFYDVNAFRSLVRKLGRA